MASCKKPSAKRFAQKRHSSGESECICCNLPVHLSVYMNAAMSLSFLKPNTQTKDSKLQAIPAESQHPGRVSTTDIYTNKEA